MGFADIYASKPVQTGLVCYGVVMAIVSIVTANTAFSAFQSCKFFHSCYSLHPKISLSLFFPRPFFICGAATAEYSSLMGSWQTAPITGILLSSTNTCPAGYDLLEGPTWKGCFPICFFYKPRSFCYAESVVSQRSMALVHAVVPKFPIGFAHSRHAVLPERLD